MEELEDKEMDTYVFNIQFLGSYRSGRSTIIGKLATGVFNLSYCVPLYTDNIPLNLEINKCLIKLKIFDLYGGERYRPITTNYFRNCSCFILVYSVSDKESFSEIDQWLVEISNHAREFHLLVLVGGRNEDSDREVSFEEGRAKADLYCMRFWEINKGEQAYEMMEEVAKEIVGMRRDKGVCLHGKKEQRETSCC